MYEAFIDTDLKPATLATIDQANQIITIYQAQGFTLTVRQLYYQFVARDLISNTEKSYQRIIDVVNKGRLAGMIDWDAIEDRTRSLSTWLHREDPHDAITVAREQYGLDMWENQHYRVEVWIEKEALAGVIEGVCGRNDVPYFSCRGYVSQSEMYTAGKRHAAWNAEHLQPTIVIHLGDHDPSGIDMTRDNDDRLYMFSDGASKVRRIALTWDQVEQYAPPPNPAKQSDSRFAQYVERFGGESWELDALEPTVLTQLIDDTIAEYRDEVQWQTKKQQLADDLQRLDEIIEEL